NGWHQAASVFHRTVEIKKPGPGHSHRLVTHLVEDQVQGKLGRGVQAPRTGGAGLGQRARAGVVFEAGAHTHKVAAAAFSRASGQVQAIRQGGQVLRAPKVDARN